MSLFKKLTYLLLVLIISIPAQAQQKERQDSLVRLMNGESAQLIEQFGRVFRKVIGHPATFLHNDTYLNCDTAMWDVDSHIINAIGHVQIIQNRTVLSSDKLDYFIDQNLAQFRGGVVQLQDKDRNTLRTRYLDFNTKDSVGIFQNGGVMKDKDGQIIESLNGTYDSKIKTFTFADNVNMYTDSIFVKTNRLVYESAKRLATFSNNTNAWKENNMLSANGGWYDRRKEIFLFTNNVHVMTTDQEGWSDSLYYYRGPGNVHMLGHVQVMDTTRNVAALAGSIFYEDKLSQVTLTRHPAIVIKTHDQDKLDTVYVGANKLVYKTTKKCDIDSLAISAANARIKDLSGDPVTEYRRKAAADAAKQAEDASKDDPNRPPEIIPGKGAAGAGKAPHGKTSGGKGPQAKTAGKVAPEKPVDIPKDTMKLESKGAKDSLSVKKGKKAAVDSAKVQKDTTKIGFLTALKNVKIYRKDMQVVCDSLLYSDLDSLARLFKKPVVWNDVTRQYSADSIFVVMKNSTIDRAHLLSDAFIITQEDSIVNAYDQIKGTEMVAYFDSTSTLRRFDALGGASALFYLKEHDALATVNKVESKMLYAIFKKGDIDRIFYFDAAKNDAYPVVQLTKPDRELKGFNWQDKLRPKTKDSVTPLDLRLTERKAYEARPRATYHECDEYFPGYMKGVYKMIAKSDSLKRVHNHEAAVAREKEKVKQDSLHKNDSTTSAQLRALDSLTVKPSPKDSLTLQTDTTTVNKDTLDMANVKLTPEMVKKQLQDKAKAEKAKQKAARIARRDAKIAALDKRDADKAQAKKDMQLAKKRELTAKTLRQSMRVKEREDRKFEKYKARFEKRKAREDAKALKRLKNKGEDSTVAPVDSTHTETLQDITLPTKNTKTDKQ
jgi:hypothetical protein